MSSTPGEEPTHADSWRSDRILAVVSVLPALPLAVIYLIRPDSYASLTVWPVWGWAIASVLPLLFCFRRRPGRAVWLALLVWAAFVLILAEEPKSLFRYRHLDSEEFAAAKREGRGIRVVSLNCAGGSVEAMREVAGLNPDILLLQESPTERQVRDFAREAFGSEAGVFVGFDASIIVRGTLTHPDMPAGHRAYYVRGTAAIRNGPRVDVVSLRLTPACVRVDLWSPSCWREHAQNRRMRREQLRVVVEEVGSGPNPIVLAGDFNAPQDDSVFELLRPGLRDTFKQAGSGWGNTIINDAPLLRIDQVWASSSLEALAVVSRKTVNSDHRMVVADLALQSSAGK